MRLGSECVIIVHTRETDLKFETIFDDYRLFQKLKRPSERIFMTAKGLNERTDECFIANSESIKVPFSALTLLVGRQEGSGL